LLRVHCLAECHDTVNHELAHLAGHGCKLLGPVEGRLAVDREHLHLELGPRDHDLLGVAVCVDDTRIREFGQKRLDVQAVDRRLEHPVALGVVIEAEHLQKHAHVLVRMLLPLAVEEPLLFGNTLEILFIQKKKGTRTENFES